MPPLFRRLIPCSARALGLGLLLLALPAQAGGDPADRLRSVQITHNNYAADRASLVSDYALLSPAELTRLSQHEDWRVRHQAAVVALWREDRTLAQTVETLSPRVNRAGQLMFTDPSLDAPGATTLLSDRLLHSGESPDVRVALARAVAQDGSADLRVVMGIFASEKDERVRATLISGLRRHNDQTGAVEGLRLAMSDPSATVRAEAAGSAGYRNGGEALGPDLIRLLADPSAEVRGLAARSLGWLHVEESYEGLLGLLSDSNSDVRLQALHALERVNESRARTAPEVIGLMGDPDPRVARAASEILK